MLKISMGFRAYCRECKKTTSFKYAGVFALKGAYIEAVRDENMQIYECLECGANYQAKFLDIDSKRWLKDVEDGEVKNARQRWSRPKSKELETKQKERRQKIR